jgi:predicted metal-dependent TIM-barrel fold hydrolase
MGSNLAIPFWVVGHIHLSLNIYKDIYEILSSCGMNILVLLAFWFEWKKEKKKNPQNN